MSANASMTSTLGGDGVTPPYPELVESADATPPRAASSMLSLRSAKTTCVHTLGIDVRTADSWELRKRLSRVKSTVSVEDGGVYAQDVAYSQVHITTTLAEQELDDWLYEAAGDCGYVGVFLR